MIKSEVMTRRFSVSPDVLWHDLIQTLTTVPGVTLGATDEARLEARFTTGVSATSWGENMIAKVESTDDGGSSVRITGQVRHTFLTTGWGERVHRRQFTRTLVSHLERGVASTPEEAEA